MSTRGWYEYHVIDPATNRRTLAMQFYKWGDAIPEHALDEWCMLSEQIDKAAGLLPVVWLDDLLRQALGEQYARLPAHFSVAAFLFLIQRAEEEQRSFNNWEFRALPKEERPDYRLGFAIGEAMALAGFWPRAHPDQLLDRVLGFIAAGHFVRPWRDYCLTWSVLKWLQYLTQVTLEHKMSSIAGDLEAPVGDISYRYRFFIWIDAQTPFKITRLAVELCDPYGGDLFVKLEDHSDKPAMWAESDREEASRLMDLIAEGKVDRYSLKEAEATFQSAEDSFWGPHCHERPPLPLALAAKR
jgi:hypothetical protein